MSNATLELNFGEAGVRKIGLHIHSIGFGVEQQLASSQLHKGTAHEPVRITGEVVRFEVAYSAQNYNAMDALMNALMLHSANSLTTVTGPTKVVIFDYHKIGRRWQGIISEIEKGDRRFQTVYRRMLTLRVLRNLKPNTSTVINGGTVVVPTASSPKALGSDWYKQRDLENWIKPWSEKAGLFEMLGRVS